MARAKSEAPKATPSKAKDALIWVLFALLILGLGGFGVDSFLSSRVVSIGTVGGRDIPAEAYARALEQALRQLERERGRAVTMAEAQTLGLDGQVRAELAAKAALEAEALRLGLSVSDQAVAKNIASISAFWGPDGQFDRESYRLALENAGYTPARFEEEIRSDLVRTLVQTAVAGGVAASEALRRALIDHYATRRTLVAFALDASHLTAPVPEPDQAAIEDYYKRNIERFTSPEMRRVAYALLSPEMLVEEVPVDEAAVRNLYELRAADYRQPERRIVDRLLFPDLATAEAALARLASGMRFEELVAERGFSLEDVDLGIVTEADLGRAGALVFAAAEPGAVVGPVETPLGPALFRVNVILAAHETPFEEVAAELRSELALERARRLIAERHDEILDLLAGGVSVAELAETAGMESGQIDWHEGLTQHPFSYAELRSLVAELTPGAFPEARLLEDGSLAVVQVLEVIPSAPLPFETVREAARAGAEAEALEAALRARAQELAHALSGQDPARFAEAQGLELERFVELTRLDGLGGLPAGLVERIHEASAGSILTEAQGGRAWIVVVERVLPPNHDDARTARLVGAIDRQLSGLLAEDLFAYFLDALMKEVGVQFDFQAIETVHRGFR